MLAEHQRRAVARAVDVLAVHRGVILADEPGLGKSFVAAAVAAEAEQRGATVEVIVPAGLVAQWSETLRRFGVSASIATHDGIARECGNPAPLASFQVGSSRSTAERLVIVDEAHAFRNPRTQRYAALAQRTTVASVLLVTATPVCNSPADLQALMALIVSDDALAGRGVPSIDAAFTQRDFEALDAVVSELVIRRGPDVLEDSLKFGSLERVVVRHPVADVASLIDALEFPLVAGAPLLRRFLRRRVESSEAAMIESVRRQVRFYERALECRAAGTVLTKRDYRRAFVHEEDRDAFQQVLFWDFWIGPTGERATAGEIEAEMRRLAALRASAAESPSPKRSMLRDIAAGSAEPMLVFTGSAATARDLLAVLRPVCRCGIATARDGRGAIRAFSAGAIDVLVATDIAGEGLNFQRAGVVVHYDIPWNPVRLDQRNGRLFRIGQKRSSVRAIYFLPEGDETRIIATMASKNRMRRRVLRQGPVSAEPAPSSIRPRLTSAAAAVRFFAAIERRGLSAPEWLERRHRAGLEQLLDSLARQEIDSGQIDDLLAIVAAERR